MSHPTVRASLKGQRKIKQEIKDRKWTQTIAIDRIREILIKGSISIDGCSDPTWKRFINRTKKIKRSTFEKFCNALELSPEEIAENIDNIYKEIEDMPSISDFYGRKDEVNSLKSWIIEENYRLVSILGMGGIGKTTLTIKLVEEIENQFQYIYWKSLQNVPSIASILADLIKFVSNQKITDLPKTLDGKINLLIEYLESLRCLIVLDNAESILSGGDSSFDYLDGYEGYGQLLKKIGSTSHQSCLLLTSRENFPEASFMESNNKYVRSFNLYGLSVDNIQEIFRLKGSFTANSKKDWENFVEYCRGNPFILRNLSSTIQDLYKGNVSEFIQKKSNQIIIQFSQINDFIEKQFERLSYAEKQIMYWLTIEREYVSIEELNKNIILPLQEQVSAILQRLIWRYLIETNEEKSFSLFTQQPVVMEYVTQNLITQICQEIETDNLDIIHTHTLFRAKAKEHIRKSQHRQIVQPIIDKLISKLGSKKNLKYRLKDILAYIKNTPSLNFGYAAGNIINLLIQLEDNLNNYDLSCLTIRQVYFQNTKLQNVNFTDSNLFDSIFIDTFGSILSTAFSIDGTLLAAGDTNGQIHVWEVKSGQKKLNFQAHEGWIMSIAFSPYNDVFASCSNDKKIKLWDKESGECHSILQGHDDWVMSVDFSPDGKNLASGSADHTVKIWNINKSCCLHTLQEHTNRVWSVAYSLDGKIIASSSDDKTVKIYNTNTYKCIHNLQQHDGWVFTIAFGNNGEILASGSEDNTIKLWNVTTGKHIKTLYGHKKSVTSVAFSIDGDTLVSGSDDKTIRFYDVLTGDCFKTLKEHNNRVWSVVFNPNSQILASGSEDQTIKLWNSQTSKHLQTFQGYTNWIHSIAPSPDGQFFTTGSDDQKVRLWNIKTGECIQTLHEHTDRVWSVAFNRHSKLIASGSGDRKVKLWDIETSQCQTFPYHSSLVLTVNFSPDGRILASAGEDKMIVLLKVNTGTSQYILNGHTSRIRCVRFSPNSKTLASGSEDKTIKLWNVENGECIQTLSHINNGKILSLAFNPEGTIIAGSGDADTIKFWDIKSNKCVQLSHQHQGIAWSIAFSFDGEIFASASQDGRIKLWDVRNLNNINCFKILKGHKNIVRSIAFNFDGQTLISGSQDETIKIWSIKTGECLNTYKLAKPYEGMNLTNIEGLTEAEKFTLKKLGAF